MKKKKKSKSKEAGVVSRWIWGQCQGRKEERKGRKEGWQDEMEKKKKLLSLSSL